MTRPPRPRRPRPSALAALVLLGATGLAGCGGDDGGEDAGAGGEGRTIQIEMRDIAFSPDTVDVEAGETVTFVFENVGKIPHDAYVGDAGAQDEHEMEMQEMDEAGHGDHGAGADAVTVEPGKRGELTHTFEAGDRLLIGCHQPGHYAAGMKVTVNVG